MMIEPDTNTEHKKQMRFLTRRNINNDITHRCSLECPRCQRSTSFTFQGIKVPGEDMTLKDFEKVAKHFNHMNFCGQLSDPVHHPNFIEILKITNRYKNSVSVHHATGAKPMDWYVKAFEANPKARWWFALDGTPETSPIYRINQDGWKIYEILKLAKKHCISKPVWQFIIFSYNVDQQDEAYEMAKKIGVDFVLITSSRWLGDDDPLKPSDPDLSLDLHHG